MIVCVGATGLLGTVLVNQLVSSGQQVRCLVRKNSNTDMLLKSIAEIRAIDFSDCSALTRSLQGADTVISTFATNIAREPETRRLWQNDYLINFRLICAAQRNCVRKFIFTSYWGLAKFGDFEHGMIKKTVEDLLLLSGMDYTIFRITTLATDMSLLLGASLKKRGLAPVVMKKDERVRPILLDDLAGCIVNALDNPNASKQMIEVAGKEEYTFLELEALFSKAIGRKVRFIFIPLWLANFCADVIDALTGKKYNARGLVSAFTGGSTCDIREMERIFGLPRKSFRNYLINHFKTGQV